MLTDEEDHLIDALEERFGAHTVILYGSRAQGTHRPDSDWDILAICPHQGPSWYHSTLSGVGAVNAYIFTDAHTEFKAPLSPLFTPVNEFVRLRHGRVLVEENSIGTKLIQKAKELYARGPDPWTTEEDRRYRYVAYDHLLSTIANPANVHELRILAASELLPLSLHVFFQYRRYWKPANRDLFHAIAHIDPNGYTLLLEALSAPPDAAHWHAWLDHAFTKAY